ncbi:MAG: DUF108 domain-containing protein, partial [Candidatus Omnitrophica bacterium]|nr:DUF108 domain-containing protein [Candidatus Omnitrophota bacterium]
MKQSKIKVGIIGCGTIGSEIAKACQGRLEDKVVLSAICDVDTEKARALNGSLKKKVSVLPLREIIKKCSFLVEAASASVSGTVLKKCVEAKKDCLVMSVGGILGKERLLKNAEARGVRVYIPSGAICGIDGLKSASIGRIDSVTLTTTKPPKGLAGAPFLKSKGIDVSDIKEDTVVFEGAAEEAVKGFPQNINVSAVLSLAGIGAGKTRVRIVASPSSAANVHEVEIIGEAGRLTTRSENMPSKSNPK